MSDMAAINRSFLRVSVQTFRVVIVFIVAIVPLDAISSKILIESIESINKSKFSQILPTVSMQLLRLQLLDGDAHVAFGRAW